MKTLLDSQQALPISGPQGAVISSSRLADVLPRPSGTSGLRSDDSVQRGTASELPQTLHRVPPAPKRPALQQGPLARLPTELGGRIFSCLRDESLSAQLRLRLVSRGFERASRNALPELDDQIASNYLRQLLRRSGEVDVERLEPFFVRHAPKMRNIWLARSYCEDHPGKRRLLFRLFTERRNDVRTLDMSSCPALEQLPEGLSVGGDLNLKLTSIIQLPLRLSVGGSLDLSRTCITQLPQALSVGKNLCLYGTSILHLPQGLCVGGHLNLSNSLITQLPAGLSVGKNLDLTYTRITQLPQGLSVGGDLKLWFTRITQLPQGLRLGGSLDLGGSGITQLPPGFSVSGGLRLWGTPIAELPLGLSVGGDLDLRNTPITQLPRRLTVGGNLLIEDTGITQLPEDLSVVGTISR